jgi:hypothetical protein
MGNYSILFSFFFFFFFFFIFFVVDVVVLAIGLRGEEERDDVGDRPWRALSSDNGGRRPDQRDRNLPFRCAVKSASL